MPFVVSSKFHHLEKPKNIKKYYAFHWIRISRLVLLGFLCTFWSWRTLFFIVVRFFIANSSMLRLPIHNLFLLFSCIRKDVAETWRKYFLIILFLNLFIWTSINRFVALNIIWSSLCLCWIFRIFIIFKKWSSFGIIWFENLWICIAFSFYFEIIWYIQIC